MALCYCEVCGVLIKGEGRQDLPEGVICDECFGSRRAEVPSSSDAVEVSERQPVQFECIYCSSVLRLKVVLGQRTHIRCPKCSETFFLREDGSVEARLEGNTTAILVQDEKLRDLTPGTGVGPSRTQPIDMNKTAPMPKGVSSLLEGSDLRLLPESDEAPLTGKTAEQLFATGGGVTREPVMGEPMTRESMTREPVMRAPEPTPPTAPPDTLSPALAALDRDDLEFMPEQEGAGGRITARRQALEKAQLRASDEGKLDLGADELKRKTSRYQRDEVEARRKTKVPSQGKQKTRSTGKQKVAGKKSKASDRLKAKAPAKRRSASERLRKRKAAVEQGQALEIESDRRALVTMAVWVLVLVPFLLAVGLVQLAERDAPLVDPARGVGQALERGGAAADKGVRALNALLPEAARVPGITEERAGSHTPAKTAPAKTAAKTAPAKTAKTN